MSFVRIGSGVHHVRIDGPDGAPALVFLHSLGTDLRIWDEVADRLSDAFRIVRIDIRGHGLSLPSPAPYSLDDLAADLAALQDALSIERATFCGVSVGGAIAVAHAASCPARVTGLVACDTPFRKPDSQMWNDRIATVTERGMSAISDAVMRRWFSAPCLSNAPEMVAVYRQMLEQCTTVGYTGVCAALRDADVAARCRWVRCPTLVLCGDADEATPPDSNRELAAAIPGARFVLIEGAGHLPCVEQPAAVASHVRSFVAEHVHA